MALWRVEIEGEARWARGPASDGPRELLAERASLDELLGAHGPSLTEAHTSEAEREVPTDARVLVPLAGQEVWASGVTYLRSREARRLESAVPDHYDLVYDAIRPELFLKAAPGRSRGPAEPVGIRADSDWDVPEPELGLVADHRGEIVAYVIGNDMSSRRIEGENPLYLPQAKSYDGSCAVGPCLVPLSEAPEPTDMEIRLRIERSGRVQVAAAIGVSSMRRRPHELVDWLFRAMSFPAGVVLLTGTGIVPDDDFTLVDRDQITITITGLGQLSNPVTIVGTDRPRDATEPAGRSG